MHSPGRRAAFKESKENQNTNKKTAGMRPSKELVRTLPGHRGVTKACVPEFSDSGGDEEVRNCAITQI